MMFWKEWREAVRFLPIAMIAVAVLLWINLPIGDVLLTPLARQISSAMMVVSALYAIAIGLMQTLPEQRSEVRGLLFSQPISRTRIYFAKTFAAIAVHSLAMAIPMLIAWGWLASVAPETRPATPISLAAGVFIWIAGFSFYPATIWMVSRRARWVGSRPLPLLTAALAVGLAFAACFAGTWTTFGYWMLPVGVILAALLTIAHHAYVALSDQSPRLASDGPGSRISAIGLTLSVLLAWTIISFVFFSFSRDFAYQLPGDVRQTRVDSSGDLYQTVEEYRWDPEKQRNDYVVVQARAAVEAPLESPYVRPTEADQISAGIGLTWIEETQIASDPDSNSHLLFQPISDQQYNQLNYGYTWIYHGDGYFLLYSSDQSNRSTSKLAGSFDRGGIRSGAQPFDASDPSLWGNSAIPYVDVLVDHNGIYQIQDAPLDANPLLLQNIDAVCSFGDLAGHGPTAVVTSGNEMSLFHIHSTNADVAQWLKSPQRNEYFHVTRLGIPKLELEKFQTIQLPSIWFEVPGNPVGQIVDFGDDGFLLVKSNWFYRAVTIRIGPDGKVGEIKQYMLGNFPADSPTIAMAQGCLPPLVQLALAAESMFRTKANGGTYTSHVTKRYVGWLIVATVLHILVAIGLTLAACRRRSLCRRDQLRWLAIAPLLGVAVPLAVLSLHSRVATAVCDQCGKRKRVDDATCPHCHADWSAPPRSGIEIFARSK
ncbi:ABC transporter permease [Novipirellula rosea]|uniref:ABC-2 family transporter protein n=1 Tax=Novipirellula rosea TaxID=1031540 RepID=A0ABP8NSH5_9BACT